MTARFDALPAGVLRQIAEQLPPNEVACGLRLANKALAKLLGDCVLVKLSQLVPPDAFVKCFGSSSAADGVRMADLPRQLRLKFVVLTARSGSLANLQVAVAAAGCPLAREVFDAAAASGSEVMCRWLLDNGCPMGVATVEAAAAAGHLELVLWLLRELEQLEPHWSGQYGSRAWCAAAAAGNRAMCEGLLAAKVSWGDPSNLTLHNVAKCGNVDMTNWLLEMPPAQIIIKELEEDIRAGMTDSDDAFGLRLFVDNLVTGAILGFDLPSLQQLFSSLLESEELASLIRERMAEEYGAAEYALMSHTPDWRAKLEWVQQQGARFNPDWQVDEFLIDDFWETLLSFPDAMERLQLLNGNYYLDDRIDDAIEAAVRVANLEALRYLYEPQQGGRVTDSHAVLAADSGNVALLAALLALGCPIAPDVVTRAARKGHLAILELLAGTARGEDELQRLSGCLTEVAVEAGSVELMRWLRARGCRWAKGTFAAAVRAGCGAAFLDWLVAAGCPVVM